MAPKAPVDLPGTRILNGANWANNAATENLANTSATPIIFDQSTPGRDSDRWIIKNYLDGYRIFNIGSKNWASLSSGNQVLGVPDFDGETCKWEIEYTGDNQEFWIREPKVGGAVWTVALSTAQAPSTVFLRPLNEQDTKQRFTFIVPE